MQTPAAPIPAEVPGLLQITEQAYALASQGALSVVDLFNTAQRLTDAAHPDIALQLYRVWLARTESPLAYAVQFNLGVLLDNAKDNAGAEVAYRAAIALQPTFVMAYPNLGNLLEHTGRVGDALIVWRSMFAFVGPNASAEHGLYLQVLNNMGRLSEIQGELVEAEYFFAQSIRQDPMQADVLTRWIAVRQKLCEWPVFPSIEGLALTDMLTNTSALSMLSVTDDPALQLDAVHRYVNQNALKSVTHYMSSRQSYGHERLRIAYLSSNFGAHAASNLTAELYRLHDRSKVEVFGFCWGGEDVSPVHARAIAGMDHYFLIDAISDREAACLIRSHEIDVLVDLDGLASGSRHDIMSYRPALLQIAWLAFPGPTALPEVDYVVGDSFVFPPELEAFFTEKPLRMPHTFQISDCQRTSGSSLTRQHFDLPDGGFVFCFFDSNSKLTLDVFCVWMRILDRVPGSVLWIVVDSERVRENLRKTAEAHGIESMRLCFSPRGMLSDDLAHYRLADLMLDTFPFGGSATACDALRAGLPVLTCAGRSFASRMAGSLLRAIELPELITDSLLDYEEKAVGLGLDRDKIDAMKRRLDDHHRNCVLNDSQRFVRDLEVLYEKIAGELSAAPMKSSYRGIHHAFVEPLGAELDVPDVPNDRRYVIAAPPFQHNSAGIRVLYELQKWLVRAGEDAIVCTWSPDYPIEQFADDIVIYPEVAPGNLLKAKRVIRYILNVPGKLGHGENQYDKNEILVAYNKDLAPYSNGAILQVPSTEGFFHARGAVKTLDAYFVGKGQDLGKHPADCIAITKEFPATRREVAALLRSVKTLYMYDDFSMIAHEAELCGCEVKLIQRDGQIVDYPHYFYPTIDEFKVQLHNFIKMTKCL